MRRDPHLKPNTDDLGLQRQGRELRERAVDMMARLALIAKVMLCRCEKTIGHHQIGGIAGIRCQRREAPREFERSAKIAVVELVDAQATKRVQTVGKVTESIRSVQR